MFMEIGIMTYNPFIQWEKDGKLWAFTFLFTKDTYFFVCENAVKVF